MRTNVLLAAVLVGLLLTSCGGGHVTIPVTSSLIARTGMNLSILDLIVPLEQVTTETMARMAVRGETYLTEIEAAGYLKVVRIPLDRRWGPQLLLWLPDLLRKHNFKLLAILSQGIKDDDGIHPERDIEWARTLLPQIADIVIGIGLSNEQWGGPGSVNVHPVEFAAWHNAVSPTIRELMPGLPIIEGDVDQRGETSGWWHGVEAAGITNVDVLSLHLTGDHSAGDLDTVANFVRSYPRYAGRCWITEGEISCGEYLRGKGLNVEQTFIYTWNTLEEGLGRRPGGGILP